MLRKITANQYSVCWTIIIIVIIIIVAMYGGKFDSLSSWASEGVSQLLSAILASAVFALLYGHLSKNKEAKEIAELVVKEIIGTYPIKTYPATNQKSKKSEFDKDLKESLIYGCKEFYYYEGVNLKTACKCLEYKIKSNTSSNFPDIFLFISKLSKLQSQNRDELLLSIKKLIHYTNLHPEINMTIYILPFDTGFHVHMTDEKVWFSPFRGIVDYPTTYCYKKEDKNDNSYYSNIFQRFKHLKKFAIEIRLTNIHSESVLFEQIKNALSDDNKID